MATTLYLLKLTLKRPEYSEICPCGGGAVTCGGQIKVGGLKYYISDFALWVYDFQNTGE